jgi:dihydroorotate dehydrogenase
LLSPASVPCDSRTVMGLDFPNPVGLAAGLDKNGEHIDALSALCFGFVEIGTVTPRPQPGNPKPRLFRIPEANAIINRMGFNNLGVDRLLENVRQAARPCLLGINIGKNFDTPVDKAQDDYLACLNKVYYFADYVVVNISSPNTPGLRQLQEAGQLGSLLSSLKAAQRKLADTHGKYTPVAVKIAPDLDTVQIESIAALLMTHQIDGVIATNTTISRWGVEKLPHSEEAGGLSGAPLRDQSTQVVRDLNVRLKGALPIIAVGGIMSALDAKEKMEAGASLVQIYSGLVFRGPQLVSEIGRALCNPDPTFQYSASP